MSLKKCQRDMVDNTYNGGKVDVTAMSVFKGVVRCPNIKEIWVAIKNEYTKENKLEKYIKGSIRECTTHICNRCQCELVSNNK